MVTSGIVCLVTVNLAKIIHEKLKYHRFKKYTVHGLIICKISTLVLDIPVSS